MRLSSTFDILGPVMVGPSSSHTAGALRIARLAASLCGAPVAHVSFTLYNSFAQTYRGHGTDRALVAGVLGLGTDDPRIRDSFELARESGVSWDFATCSHDEDVHPNTVDVALTCIDGLITTVRGESVGGGRIRITRINGVTVDVTGRMPTLVVEHRDVPGMLGAMTSILGAARVNIAYMSSYRTEPGSRAYAVFETDTPADDAVRTALSAVHDVSHVYTVKVPGALTLPGGFSSSHDFASAAELLALAEGAGCSLGDVMARREADLIGAQQADLAMGRVLDALRREVREPLEKPERSLGGLIGGEAREVAGTLGGAFDLCGPTLTRALSYAMAVLERSATMGVIVAAPTAGSAGVVPGALLAAGEARGGDACDAELSSALYAAAAVGALVEHGASVSGAQGGCQAEVGTASAMAAAGLVQLLGGTPRQALAAAGIALSNLMGLVCDPVGGLVEAPCQTRNAVGVANAYTAAQLALAGVALPAPLDEVIAAMRQVGDALPASLRETALGGLAACPSCTACLGALRA
jgi:L-serine dehydratase